jgi:two-component system, response regulator YesN
LKSGELCRILIVDDEQLIRQGIKHYVQWEREGFQIVGEASNGQEALELVELTSPHIILTDIVMPIMDGEELTRIVKSKYPQIEVIILSSYGEFEYVRSTFQSGAVDYILKPKLDTESLLKVLTTATKRIPSLQKNQDETNHTLNIHHIIEKFISGYETQYDSEQIEKAFPYQYFCLIVVDARHSPDILSTMNDRIKHDLHTKQGNVIFQSFTLEKNVSAFLLNSEIDDTTKCIDLANEIIDSEPVIGILITNPFTNLSHLSEKKNKVLKKMLQYRFYFPEAKIVTEHNLLTEAPTIMPFNLDKFTNDFKHERFDLAFSYLDEHVTELSRCFTTDVFEFKSFFGNIIFNITILLGNMDYDVKELENHKFTFFNSIDEATTANVVTSQLKTFIQEAKKSISAKNSQTSHSNFKMILDYIEEHFAEPLSLTSVAQHFHFNPSYLSSYFASHNREGFNEYLNKIRIEEAVRLLVNQATPISEISGMVGYSDHSYFCKVFKKLKGVSPSKYRRSQKLK